LSNVGAIAANLHEGSRSEYLAQYVFASFGTAVAVPHQEDAGVDLICSVTERVGQLAWPVEHYTVQVKSNFDPIVFGTRESVRWLVKHPYPLLLCCVDKKALRFSVYHTLPRFQLWVSAEEPSRLELVPGAGHRGRSVIWAGDERVELDAPILEFGLSDLLEPAAHKGLKEVLKIWLRIESENLKHAKLGMRLFSIPTTYDTNSREGFTGGYTRFGAVPAELGLTREMLAEILPYAANHFHQVGDLSGAARCVILLRHLKLKRGLNGAYHVAKAINKALGLNNDLLEEGVNQLSRRFDELLQSKR
jgi:hypothetical protein